MLLIGNTKNTVFVKYDTQVLVPLGSTIPAPTVRKRWPLPNMTGLETNSHIGIYKAKLPTSDLSDEP